MEKITVEINGAVELPEGMTVDQFTDDFLEWIDSKGMAFGGGIGPYRDEDDGETLPVSN